MKFVFTVLLIIVLSLTFLWACSGSPGSAAEAVQAYLQALVEGDAERLSTISCAAWEPDAKNELASFAAVKVTLENMECSETDQEDETTLVSCSGKMIANYGNEVLEIELSDRVFQAVLEGGEWRMCGYR